MRKRITVRNKGTKEVIKSYIVNKFLHYEDLKELIKKNNDVFIEEKDINQFNMEVFIKSKGE